MPGKRAVVHLIKSLDSGGCENMLLRTLPRLNLGKYSHHIITLQELGELAPRFAELKVDVTSLKKARVFSSAAINQAVNEINRLKPVLVITYLFHADLIGRLFLQKRISVPLMPFLRTTYNSTRYWPARIFERLTRSKVSRYLANSEAVKSFYIDKLGADPNKFTVIPNGIDITSYDQASGIKIRKELGVTNNAFLITCVANLAKNKGHFYLLEAFESLFSTNTDAYLILVGEGEEKEALAEQAATYKSKERIIFMGRRSDVREILKASDVFVLPTLFEGMSNALIEAMAAGLPVVTSDIPENSMVNRERGILVPVQNSRALEKSLKTLYQDAALRKRLGDSGREYIEANLEMGQVVKLWEKVLDGYSKHS